MSNTVSAAALGLPTPSRRLILRGLAAAPIAVSVAVIPDALASTFAPDPIFAAIEKHKAAWATYEAAVDRIPNVVRPPKHIEDAADAASAIEEEVRYDMHEAVPQTVAGLAAYVAYWNKHASPPPGYTLGQMRDIGWEAIPTIAEAIAALFPAA